MKGSSILIHLSYNEKTVAKFLVKMLHLDENDAQDCRTILNIISSIGVD